MNKLTRLGKSVAVFLMGLFCGAAYLISCGQTNTAVSSGGAIDATAITAETLVTSGTITSGGAITAPSITLTTGAGSGKFLTSNSTGEASWGTPFRTSCPTGFTLIGTSGTPDAFCISTSFEKLSNSFHYTSWTDAYGKCAAKTPTANLCTISQYKRACTSSNWGVAEYGGWLQETSPYWDLEGEEGLKYNGAWIAGNDCEPQEVVSKTKHEGYRCCFS
jgi:hypothetical protein